jgi:hypothetical protein
VYEEAYRCSDGYLTDHGTFRDLWLRIEWKCCGTGWATRGGETAGAIEGNQLYQ